MVKNIKVVLRCIRCNTDYKYNMLCIGDRCGNCGQGVLIKTVIPVTWVGVWYKPWTWGRYEVTNEST